MSGDLATTSVEELTVSEKESGSSPAVGRYKSIVTNVFWVRDSTKLTPGNVYVDVDVDVNVNGQ